MRARLLVAAIALGIPAGLAAAVHADPNCLVVDELPRVGPTGNTLKVCVP